MIPMSDRADREQGYRGDDSNMSMNATAGYTTCFRIGQPGPIDGL
jgi:hypothetical protein